MALNSNVTPPPNNPISDEPVRDAIYRRWFEQISALIQQINGSGVVGPGSSTDNAIARWNGTSGQLLQNSGVIIDDSNSITGVSSFSAINGIFSGSISSASLNITSLASARVVYTGASGLMSVNDALQYASATSTLTVAGVVSLPDGSSAAPSLKIGDEQNGFYSPATNQIGITCGGTSLGTIQISNFNWVRSRAGARHSITVGNTSGIAGSNAGEDVSVGATSSGDPYNTFAVSTVTIWSYGIDNSDAGAFKISYNATLGTNDYFTMTTSGIVGMTAVNIDGGNIDGTAIGASSASTASFTNISTISFFTSTSVFNNVSTTTLFSTSTATLPLVNIDGGNIDSTAIGATTASTGAFTTLTMTGGGVLPIPQIAARVSVGL